MDFLKKISTLFSKKDDTKEKDIAENKTIDNKQEKNYEEELILTEKQTEVKTNDGEISNDKRQESNLESKEFLEFKQEKSNTKSDNDKSEFVGNSESDIKNDKRQSSLEEKFVKVPVKEIKKPEITFDDYKNYSEKKEEKIINNDLVVDETDAQLKKEFEEFKIKKILHRIDHTLLRQTATVDEIKQLCDEAKEYGFYAVCVQPINVEYCRDYLGYDSKVKIATVVSFPFGEDISDVKVFQAKRAIKNGANEIDMVMCISALKSGDFKYVKRDIKRVVAACKKTPVKVIIETGLLTAKEIDQASACVRDSGAKFVKTSTGYFGDGATPDIIRKIRQVVGDKCSIKASGGIKTADDAKALLSAGSDRLGTSSGVKIAEEFKAKMHY